MAPCALTRAGGNTFAGPKDAWRAIEAWSIVTTRNESWDWPPIGRMGRLDEDMIWWETPDGTFLFPYETACQIMNGELKEAVAVRRKARVSVVPEE